MQRILFFFEHEVLELQNSNNESLDGLAFFPTNSWPRGIQTFFHKSEIGGTNTFNFILFEFANNMSHHFLLNFLFIKYRQNPGKIHKRVFQTEWMINSIPAKETPMVLLRYHPTDISPFGWFTYPQKPLKHMNILRPLPLFLFFQEPSTITKVTEDIFEFKSTKATATTSQPIRTKASTATLKRKGPLRITKYPNNPENHLDLLLRHFHLPNHHFSNRLNRHTALHSLSPPYFREQLWSYWASSHKDVERWQFASSLNTLFLSSCIYF